MVSIPICLQLQDQLLQSCISRFCILIDFCHRRLDGSHDFFILKVSFFIHRRQCFSNLFLCHCYLLMDTVQLSFQFQYRKVEISLKLCQ